METRMDAGSSDQAASMPSSSSLPAAAMSLVLSDRDLLGEILLRLDFPTCLVHAALACKGWLRVASDPAFLRRFRDLHPPRLLGFYANAVYCTADQRPEFWPVRHAPELASAVRHAASALDVFPVPCHMARIRDCLDGRLLVSFSKRGFRTHGFPSPALKNVVISPAGDKAVLPRPLPAPLARPMQCRSRMILPDPDHGSDDDLQCFDLVVASKHGLPHRTLQVNELRQGVWGIRTSVTTELLQSPILPKVLLVGDKLYMATLGKILVLNLTSSSFSVIYFPEPIDINFHGGRLSKADDSGIYLINVIESELLIRVWLHKMVSGSMGNWVLVDTIALREIFANLGDPAPYGDFTISCVGDNGKLVLLEMNGSVFYMDVPSRNVEAVFKVGAGPRFFFGFSRGAWPVLTIWPPSFPAVKQGQEEDE